YAFQLGQNWRQASSPIGHAHLRRVLLDAAALLVVPEDAAVVAMEQEAPEARLEVREVAAEDGAEDGRGGWKEGAEDLATAGDVVRLDPVHRLRQPPEVVPSPGARHLRPFDADRR